MRWHRRLQSRTKAIIAPCDEIRHAVRRCVSETVYGHIDVRFAAAWRNVGRTQWRIYELVSTAQTTGWL